MPSPTLLKLSAACWTVVIVALLVLVAGCSAKRQPETIIVISGHVIAPQDELDE